MANIYDERARDEIDAAFAVRSAVREAWPSSPPALSAARLAAFALDGAADLSPAEWQSVRADPVLLASWRHACRCLASATLPRIAAASSSSLERRTFEGGTLQLIRSAHPGSSFVKIVWRPQLAVPRRLLLEREDQAPLVRALPSLRPSGDWLIVCEDASLADREFVELISDPRTHGFFLE